MSRLGINTGSNPNDGQGDPLRIAMGKINSNFTEIYNTFGDGNNITGYANTAGISTLARNLTGSPRINVSGILNSGITTTEHIEVRNITSTGVITATQFVGDGSQLSNVTALVGGLEVLDDNVRKGIARELNFGANIISTGPDGVGRVTISVPNTLEAVVGYATASGIATVAQGLTGTPNVSVGVITATTFIGDGAGLFNIGAGGTWAVTPTGIHTTKNVGIGTTAKSGTILNVLGDNVAIAATCVIGYGYPNSIRLSSTGFRFPDFYGSVGNDLGLEIPIGVGDFEVNSVLAKFRQTLQVGTIGAGQSACVFIDSRGYMGQGGGQGGPWIGVGAGVSINGSAGGHIQIGVTTAGVGVSIRGNTGSINATGIITASSFVGDGSGLTNVPVSGIATIAQGLTGTPNINVNQVGISSYLSVSGVSSFYNNVHIESDRAILIGDNDELQLFHSGVDSYIDNSSAGNLVIRDSGLGIQLRRSGGGPSAGLMAAFNNNAGVELYYDSVLKLQTFQNGVAINDSVGIGSTAGNPPYRLTVSGVGATITQGLANAIADFTSSVNGYGQVNVRNSLSGTNASGDIVITANNGTDISNFIDLGINNTGFTTTSWTINGALDGYLYTSDGNLSIGAAATNKYLSLFVGGTLAANEKVRVTTTGVGIGTTNVTSALTVSGDGNFTGVVTATRFQSTSAGTPTIDSPNNLNINAVTVAISTDVTVGRNLYAGINTSTGLILTSPNGSKYRLVVDNSGNLSTVLVP